MSEIHFNVGFMIMVTTNKHAMENVEQMCKTWKTNLIVPVPGQISSTSFPKLII